MVEELEKYISEGWLIKQKHPTLPLEIYNYSQKTQYDSHWDEVTLSCRGLVVDTARNQVIVKPFPKFFNYEEVSTKVPWKSSDYVYVQEKMDGSLGILFWYEEQWIMATRGSFTSEQAIRGMEILKSQYPVFDRVFEKSIAYICEIIYPENRIVVDYGKEKIVFLGAVLNRSFKWESSSEDELHWTTAKTFFSASGIKLDDIVKTSQFFKRDHELYRELKSLNTKNSEGFVLRFFPSNMRVKIKFEDYVALHRILTNVSSYDIWENLMKFGKLPEEMLKEVPDEFYSWVKQTEESLREAYSLADFQHRQAYKEFQHIENQKEYALKVLDHCKETDLLSSVLFSLKAGRDYSETIWKSIKPEYSKPFSVDR